MKHTHKHTRARYTVLEKQRVCWCLEERVNVMMDTPARLARASDERVTNCDQFDHVDERRVIIHKKKSKRPCTRVPFRA